MSDIIEKSLIKDKYDYFAFISYSRKDEKWAIWLQKSLETYKLPTILQRENPNIPKKFFQYLGIKQI